MTKPYSEDIIDKIAQLEAICGQDVGRGIIPLVQAAKGGLLEGARSLAEHSSPHVAIITGFFMPYGNPPAAETDGPIGCAQLAAGLHRVGIPVIIVTYSMCFHAVKIAVFAAGVPANVPFDIVPVADNSIDAIASILNLWESLEIPVSHIISIERAGPSDDGIIRNMKGQDITAHTAFLHLLFNYQKIISLGIGDGGNEIGMGNIPREVIKENIRYKERIGCITSCNYLIVCGVYNWGATALLAAIYLLRPEWKAGIIEGLNPDVEFHILETIVNAGLAVDGITGVQSLTVDNLFWDFHAQVLEMMIEII
ncbi:MAG: DUF4392 domain-containing protein [Tolypothrix carrinoi HA7290-LM1]|nr:DUF4392 domain-containing protein [Tolypothrix carrinoi HA7290-LM1]